MSVYNNYVMFIVLCCALRKQDCDCGQRVQTSAGAKISTKSDSGLESGLTWILMSV